MWRYRNEYRKYSEIKPNNTIVKISDILILLCFVWDIDSDDMYSVSSSKEIISN